MTRDSAQVTIVGCGSVVEEMYAPALKALGGVRVVAVCDLDDGRAQAVGEDLGAPVKALDEAISLAELVVIAAPPSAHFELVSQALAAGRSVLCEKPFVPQARQARELVDLAARSSQGLFVGHFRRLYASLRSARELLASGVIGRPQAVVATEGARFSWRAKSAYTVSDPLGGVLYDTGSHLIDMVLFATGLDGRDFNVVVNSLEKAPRTEPSHDLRTELVLRQGDGDITVTIALSRLGLLANVIRIRCELGTLELPTAPGSRLRIRGPAGTAIVESHDGETTASGSFVEQLRLIVAREQPADLGGSRFVAVTRVLEEIMGYGNRLA